MMRRFAIVLSVLIVTSVIAALGIGQSGARGQQGTSLADRLTAIRESVATGSNPTPSNAAIHVPEVEQEDAGPIEPEDVAPSQTRTALAETLPRERTRRPRLLSQLDPLNILSLGEPKGTFHEPALESNEPRLRTSQNSIDEDLGDFLPEQSSQSTNRAWDATSPGGASQPRRSPLSRVEESPVNSQAARSGRVSTALGPAESSRSLIAGQNPFAADAKGGVVVEDVKVVPGVPASVTPDEILMDDSPSSSRPSPLSDERRERYERSPSERVVPLDEDASTKPNLEDSFFGYREDISTSDPSRADVPAAVGASAEGVVSAEAEGGLTVPTRVKGAADQVGDPNSRPAVNERPGASEGNQVLSSDVAPAVSWEVLGPKQIIIGREATFEIRLRNEGSSHAERIIARIEVPASAEILSAETTHGIGQRVADGATAAVLEWRIDQLAASSDGTLKLTVVPRVARSMNLEVAVRSEPRAAIARVDVLEPKLQIVLEGPSDLLHGESRSFRINVSNPGTGPAEDVVVHFTPPGGDDKSAERHTVGLLRAGQSKTIELEVTAKRAGDVSTRAVAVAAGELREQTERRVLVRKPELVMETRGPQTTYAGTVATYNFRVRNAGDATAENVRIHANLPLGAEFIRATDDRRVEPETDKNNVKWNVGSLPPGEEYYVELRCIVNWAGDNMLELIAEGAGGQLQQSQTITTHVVALADLKLEVSDPKGPVAVGREAIYEVRIRNRGSNTAEQVNVAALFSEGIEPVGVEGGQHTIDNGRVAFRTIESLPAGREIVFKIRAIAKEPGTHVFRAEVLCRELETKLAAEETTRFYLDESPAARGDNALQAASPDEESAARR